MPAGEFRMEDLYRITDQAERTHRLLQTADKDISRISGVGESAGGKVQVRADAGGQIVKTMLDPRAMKMSSKDLADEITLAVNRAQEDVARQREQLLRDVVGETPPTAETTMRQLETVLDTFNKAMDKHEDEVDRLLREVDDV